jgi:hypothetical protein
LIFVGTLLYNLLAFPFSASNRYKAYFQQTVDLDTGINTVAVAGLEEYVRLIVDAIPSASGQRINCAPRPNVRVGLVYCTYNGLAPNVVPNTTVGVPPEKFYSSWLSYNVTRAKGTNRATFQISAKETRACALKFDTPFSSFHVKGAASNNGKWKDVPESGSDQIKLWRRDWDREWEVEVEWPVRKGKKAGEEGRNGRVVCSWADQNVLGTIPALDELYRYSPDWTAISKSTDGLVEASKAFVV